MDIQTETTYSIGEEELKEAVKYFFFQKKQISVRVENISFYCSHDLDQEPYDFSGHVRVITNRNDV